MLSVAVVTSIYPCLCTFGSTRNNLLSSQYSPEMFAHFRENEEEGVINSKYMVQQAPYITSSTRARIICAMIEVDGALSLPSEALYLAVRIFDNFLSKRPLGAHYQNVFMTPSADAAIANYSLVRLIAVGCFRVSICTALLIIINSYDHRISHIYIYMYEYDQ